MNLPVEQLQDFDVLFCKGKRLLSKAIIIADKVLARLNNEASKGEYFSHAAHFRIIEGVAFIVDAQADGVNPKLFTDWVNEYEYEYIVMREHLTPEKLARYKIAEMEVMGREYDYVGLIRQAKRITTKLLNKFRKEQKATWKAKEDESNLLYCTEHIATVRDLPNKQVTPLELLHECTELVYEYIK